MGRIDIQIEVAFLSQYQASPREGHLEELYLIFHFLSKNSKKRLVMDASVPDVKKSVFNLNDDWKDFYLDIVEEDPHQISEPLGKPVLKNRC